jgi:hypothetical protein
MVRLKHTLYGPSSLLYVSGHTPCQPNVVVCVHEDPQVQNVFVDILVK